MSGRREHMRGMDCGHQKYLSLSDTCVICKTCVDINLKKGGRIILTALECQDDEVNTTMNGEIIEGC